MPRSLAVICVVVAVSVVLAIGTITSVSYPPSETSREDVSVHGPSESIAVWLSIDGHATHTPVVIRDGETVLDALRVLDASDDAMDLSVREYPGLGTLVEGMYGHTNGTAQQFWQYEVGGIMPQIGADSFFPSEGDAISWSFKESIY